jgi:rhamnosyltransferase subunit B
MSLLAASMMQGNWANSWPVALRLSCSPWAVWRGLTQVIFIDTPLQPALGLRAVLVKKSALDLGPLPSGIVAVNYASHAWLFPRARAIVHHGGIGTIAKVLLHGKPSLAVPRALDQFDNAERARALGCMRVLPFAKLSAAKLQAELSLVLQDSSYAQAAQALSLSIAQERGVQVAADAIEALI